MEKNIKVRWWWWLLLVLGYTLLLSVMNVILAFIIFLFAWTVLYYVQMRGADLLLAKTQENIRKLQAIFHKWSPKN